MTYTRLVHKNPKLNEKTLWYRLIDQTSQLSKEWYLCTIWGPQGMISSTVHAVPKDEYTFATQEYQEPATEEEFF